ncbi:MAG: anti-sigma F factor [Clostridia bacterium]|nr:anti-sigma F factor [Clostridia bacterium]
MKVDNAIEIKMEAKQENEKLARNLIASFLLELNPSIEEISDVKTVISEAVTNCIVHGYNKGEGIITIQAKLAGSVLFLKISDNGVGIQDIKKAMQPFFTTKPDEERSGMGFTVMETFMDELEVCENVGGGVVVCMAKEIISAENVAV